jgi:methyl-accepting chemotaxis protein
MRNIPIIGKFLLVLSAFGIFTLAVAAYVGNQMWKIDWSYSTLGAGPTHAAFEVTRASRLLVKAQLSIANMLVAGQAKDLDRAKHDLAHARETYPQQLDSAATDDPSNAEAYESFKARGVDLIDKVCGPAIAAAKTPTPANTTIALAAYRGGCAGSFGKLVDDMTSKSLAVAKDVDKQDDALTGVTKGAIAATFLLIIVGFAVVMVGGFFATRSWIVSPMKALSSVMDRLARGDLQVRVEGGDRGDELGGMARAVQVFKDAGLEKIRLEAEAERMRAAADAERRAGEAAQAAAARELALVVEQLGGGLSKLSSGDLTYRLNQAFAQDYKKLQDDFNDAVAKLQDTMTVINGNTAGITAGAGEITQASDDLARRTEQQAASLEETAAALDQITATVRKTAEGADHANAVVAAARADAERSGAVVDKAVAAMGQIEASAKSIGQIIGVIDEIAFQTNLLALNAGVEAARAGDAGRGFAVVASEVRALAQRSADAAKEIKVLISNSSTQVDAGVSLVGEAGKALQRIAAQITNINSVVADIAASAKEQSAGLAQVNTAINQMDQVTQQNAAMVEEATAASHSLAQEAETLSRLIGQFRVGDGSAIWDRQSQNRAA